MNLSMNPVDMIVGGIVFLAIVFGLIRGFVTQLIQIGALVLGFFLAKTYYKDFSVVIGENLANAGGQDSKLSIFMAFFAIFLGTVIVLFVLAFMARNLIKKAKMESYDRLLGGIFGAVKGLLICSALYYAFDFYPDNDRRDEWKKTLQFKDAKGSDAISVNLMEGIITNVRVLYPELFKRIEDKIEEQRPTP